MDTIDPWALYAGTRDRLVALLRSLDPARADERVPLTPDWTVRAVAAHVCGINADVAAGRRTGLGTDERTAHQVAMRTDHSLTEICAEWLGHEAAMRAAIESDAFLGHRLAADLIVHLHDLQHALEVPIDREDDATVDAAHTYASIVVGLVPERCDSSIVVELSDGSRFEPPAGDAPHPSELRSSPYDFLRSATGRRSRRQVCSLDWVGDPVGVLDHLCPYGPLRREDAPI